MYTTSRHGCTAMQQWKLTYTERHNDRCLYQFGTRIRLDITYINEPYLSVVRRHLGSDSLLCACGSVTSRAARAESYRHSSVS